MELLTFFQSYSDIGAAGIVAGVVILIITGKLVPIGTHKRELAAANKSADEHRAASEKKDDAVNRLLDQNSALLAGVRIADKFYSDFVPSINEHTQPRQAVSDVGA